MQAFVLEVVVCSDCNCVCMRMYEWSEAKLLVGACVQVAGMGCGDGWWEGTWKGCGDGGQ